MPTYFNAKDVILETLPGMASRGAQVNSPMPYGASEVVIPEEKFNKIFTNLAIETAKGQQDIGPRNQIMRGVTGKEETFATLEIVQAGRNKDDDRFIFEDFLLQSANEVSQEKYQLIETFGETVGFFFGERPKVYQYSGTLTNTQDYPWRDNWRSYYESSLRGTKLVEGKKRAYLTYDYVLREGYVLALTIGQNSSLPNSVDFTFSMFITKEVNLQPAMAGKALAVRKRVEDAKEEMIAKAKAIYTTVAKNVKAIKDSASSFLTQDGGSTSQMTMGTGPDVFSPWNYYSSDKIYPEELEGSVNPTPYPKDLISKED